MKNNQTNLESTINNLGTRIQQLESRLEGLEKTEASGAEIQKQTKTQFEHVATLANRLDDVENRSRRLNLVFYGLKDDDPQESWEACENAVKSFCQQKLQVNIGAIQRVHRMGKHDPKRNRPIIACFASFKDTETIMSSCIKLKGTDFSVSRDYSPRLREIRRKLWEVGKARKADGQDKVFLVHDKLIINNEAFVWNSDTQTVIKLNKK